MASYRYELKLADGKITQGVLQAANLNAASQELRARGGYILALSPIEQVAKKGFAKAFNLQIGFGPSARDVPELHQSALGDDPGGHQHPVGHRGHRRPGGEPAVQGNADADEEGTWRPAGSSPTR